MHFSLILIVTCVLIASVIAVPAPQPSEVQPQVEAAKHKKFESKVSFTIGGDNPAEIQESIRKARQIFEENINIDIIEGGGGYNQGYNQGYGGYNQGYGGYNQGYGGGYGGGYQETDIDINVENFGK